MSSEQHNPNNHSGNANLDKYIGTIFYWNEPWEWDDENKNEIDSTICDDDGNPPNELNGDWIVESINADGETAWVSFVPGNGNYLMELPLSWLPHYDD